MKTGAGVAVLVVGTVLFLGAMVWAVERSKGERVARPPADAAVGDVPTRLPNADMPTPPRQSRDEWLDAKPEPTFKTRSANAGEAEKEMAAERAIYDRCSKFAVWREGTELGAFYVAASPGYPEMVNVTAELRRKREVANGNTLWYQVWFAGGEPARFSATKDIAAELCGLGAREVVTNF